MPTFCRFIRLILVTTILWCGAVFESLAIQSTANVGAPPYLFLPSPSFALYVPYSFYMTNGSTFGFTAASSNMLFTDESGSVPVQTRFILCGSYSAGNPLANVLFNNSSGTFPYSFNYVVSSTSVYTLLVTTSLDSCSGNVPFTVTGTSPWNVASDSQTFNGVNFIGVLKQGAGTAVAEGAVSGTTTVNEGILDFGDAYGNSCTVSGDIVIGAGAIVRLQNITGNTLNANISSTSNCYIVNNVNGLTISGNITGSSKDLILYGSTILTGTLSSDSMIIENHAGYTLQVNSELSGTAVEVQNFSGGTAILNGALSGWGIKCTNTGGIVAINGNITGHSPIITNSSSGVMTISGSIGDACRITNNTSSTMTLNGVTNGANIGVTNTGTLSITNSFTGTGTSFLTQTAGSLGISSSVVIPAWNLSGGSVTYSGNGTLILGAASVLGNGASGATINNSNGGTLNVAATTINHTTFANTNGTLVISGNVGNNNTFSNSVSSTMTLSGTTSGANINISNSGAATLSGDVTGTGNSSIDQRGGTLSVSGNFSMPTWNIYGGTMTFTGSAKAYAPSQITFYLGDGNAQGISPVTTGKIVVAGSGNTFSPDVVNVALDNTTIVNASDLVDASQTNRSWTLIEGITNTPVLGVVPSVGGIFTWHGQKVGNSYVVNVAQASLTQANTVITTTETIDVGGDSIREVSTNVSEVNSTQFRSFASHAKRVMQQMFWSKSNRSEPLSMDSMRMDSINKPMPIQLTPQTSDSHVYVSGIHMRGKTDAVHGSDASSDMQSGMIMGMDHTFKKSQTYLWGYIGGTVGLLEVTKDRSNRSTSKTMLGGVSVTQDFWKEAEWVNAINGSRTISSAQRSGQHATNQPILFYHSRIKSDCASATSSLAYKFKWKHQSNDQTYFSMRPYLGAQGIRTIRYAYKERESNGISRGRLNTNTINGISGLGFRIKGEAADWNIKTTLSAGVTQQLNITKVTDKIYSLDTPQGLSMDITGAGRTTVSGNFTMNFSKKDAPCKISVALQASRKAHRSTQSCMLQFTHSF